MISLARRNVSRLVSNPNSLLFLCNSNLHFFLSTQSRPFSTSRIKRVKYPISNPAICDVLVNKHKFSPESASLASSRLPNFGSPERADSVLSFLRECSFTTTQLQRIVAYYPRILGFTIESLKSRLQVFLDLGLSLEDTAKIISMNQSIVYRSVAESIIPKLCILKRLLGSNREVTTLLKRSSWFLSSDLDKTLLPNVEVLKSYGMPMEFVLSFLWSAPRAFLIKPDIMRKSVDRAIEMGVSRTSTVFIRAVTALAYTSEGMWEVKLQTLRDLGFSDDDTLAMFRKQPLIFAAPAKKMKYAIEFLLATGKYNVSSIVLCPVSLGYSIERRLEPRLRILEVLEIRNLIKKWPALSSFAAWTDERFINKFIRPYYAEIGEEYMPKIFIDRGKKGDLMLKEHV